MPPKLDLRTLLPRVREAFDAGQLPGRSCSYSGGCAIGVGMRPKDARSLENQLISFLIQDGAVIVPGGQVDDFQALQVAHDRWWEGSITRDDFGLTLSDLEARYL